MQVTFYGVRGSYPVSRRDQLRYGGNSTCIHVRSSDGQDLILDGGSGIRKLGDEMMERQFGAGQGKAFILVGHTHWDHILGYPFFAPFYQEGNEFQFVSAGQTNSHIRDILSGQHEDLHFPVPFEQLDATMDFMTFKPGEHLTLGPFSVETVQLNHPGITVGYRIEADGAALCVFTDTARITKTRLGDGMGGPKPDAGYAKEFKTGLAHCARNADVLVHDSHFLEHELVGKYHWGHSSYEDALEMADLASVRQLILFHHAPEHSDSVVDRKLSQARDLARNSHLIIAAAADGMRAELSDATRLGSGTWQALPTTWEER